MSLDFVLRASAVAVLATVPVELADLKGNYNVEFVVQETSYTGTVKAEAGTKGAFTAKFDFTSPSTISADATGKTAGDSVTYEAKYEDKGRGCTGTFVAKGTVEKDRSKAAGSVDIVDSCSGAISGTFRLWR